MSSEPDMPPKKGAQGRKKDAIHFVNARPASETERLDIKRMVRAHVGKWISTQTKDRAAGPAVVVDPPLVPSAEHTDPSQAFELDSDDPYLPSTCASSTLSPVSSASSRASPESCISSSSHTAIPVTTAPPHTQAELTLAIIPPRTIFPPSNPDLRHPQSDDQDGVVYTSDGSDTPSPPHNGEYIETVGAGRLDPFRAYAAQFEPEFVQISEEYCTSISTFAFIIKTKRSC